MFIMPMGKTMPMKRDFGNANHAELRMLFTLSRKSKRLMTVKGGAAYLHIFSQILKKFSLSDIALTSGLVYRLRMKKGASRTVFFFFFGMSLTPFAFR